MSSHPEDTHLRALDDSSKDFKTGPAISPISWLDAKQPRPRERGGEAHESNEMECCRRAGDRSFSLRLPVRNSAPPGPGHRGDLPDTFGQLSYPKLTSSRFHLLLPRIGDRHRGRHIGTLSGVGWQIVDLQQISQSSVKSIIMHATVGAVTRRRFPVGAAPPGLRPTTSISYGIGWHLAATFRRRCDGWTYQRMMVEPGRWGSPRLPIASPMRSVCV